MQEISTNSWLLEKLANERVMQERSEKMSRETSSNIQIYIVAQEHVEKVIFGSSNPYPERVPGV